MKPTLPTFRSILLAVLVLAAAGSALAADTPFHFGLAKSVPADKASVHHAAEVKLWFTESPSEGTVTIRLIDAAGEAVETSDSAQDPEDATAFSITPTGDIAPGLYSVSWRGMGADGHVVRGDFTFTLAGH